MSSSEVGSAHCRSSKASTIGCDRAPPEPRRHRRQLPAPHLLGREFRGAVRRQRDVDERRESGAYSAGSSPTSCRVFSRSARRCSAGRSAPNRRRPHSATGCSGVFCNSCDDDHSTQVCGVSPSRARNSSISRDLPIPGSPTISTSWPSPVRARSQRRLKMSNSSSRPTNGVSAPRAAAPAAAARAHDAKEVHRFRYPFELVGAELLGDKQPGDLPLHVRGDEDGARFGRALHARGDIRRLAEHFAGRVHHHRPGFQADAGDELRRPCPRVPGVEFGERALDRERGAHRALGVVLLRVRIAEQGHQTIAEPFQYVAAKARHRLRSRVEIGPDEIPPILRVEPRRKARRADEIAEHNGDGAALGGVRLTGGIGVSAARGRGRWTSEYRRWPSAGACGALKTRRSFRGRRPSDRSEPRRRCHSREIVLCTASRPRPRSQTSTSIPRFLRPASPMMVSRGRSVHSVGQE